MPADMPWRSMRLASRIARGRQFDLSIDGVDRVPKRGPVIIAAHHHHHLYDGAALTLALDRPVHIVAALDWIKNPRGRALMERACDMARWPVVERLPEGSAPTRESTRTLFRSLKDVTRLLEEGRVVAIFPEGFPNIDPGFTPKSDQQRFLPFKNGFVRFAAIAARTAGPIPVIPAGFVYEQEERWQITLRFGAPVWISPTTDLTEAGREIEQKVRSLSTAETPGTKHD
jgi:putative membrane protein